MGPIELETPALHLIDRSRIFSRTNQGFGNAGTIRLSGGPGIVSDILTISTRSRIITSANSAGTGQAGSIELNAAIVNLSDGSIRSNGRDGAVTINTGGGPQTQIKLEDTSTITTNGIGTSKAGDIKLYANAFELSGSSTIRSENIEDGDSGSIELRGSPSNVSDTLTLNNGSRISTSNTGTGSAGRIDLNFENLFIQDSEVSSENQDGGGGQITIDALGNASERIEINEGGWVSTSTSGLGQAGTIKLAARQMSLTGAQVVSESTSGQIDSGDAGSIVINGLEVLEVLSGSSLSTSTSGGGNAGNITIGEDDAGHLTEKILVDGGSVISTSEGVADFGAGKANAGSVNIGGQINQIVVTGNGTIGTSTAGSGNAGSIIIGPAAELSIAEEGPIIGELTEGSLREFLLTQGGVIDSSSTSTEAFAGRPGAINIAADSVRIQDAGALLISALNSPTVVGETASDSSILISAVELVEILNSRLSANVQNGFSKGGNVSIDPVFVILNGSSITANADAGPGGNIFIRADFYFQSLDSFLSASSNTGVDGTITLVSPILDLSGNLVQLSGEFFNADNWIVQECSLRTEESGVGSFTVVQQMGPPGMPDDLLTMPVMGNFAGKSVAKAMDAAASYPVSSAMENPADIGEDCNCLSYQ